ncbi:MAG TPA: hypothetical protein VFL13_09565 [Candidatus Baltobacteraceae bacterium]|nr:hypothetical protein [Candidatus Baltobacteraceae bacterium]
MALVALVLAAVLSAPFTLEIGKPGVDLESHTGVWEMKVAPDEIAGLSLRVIARVPFGTMTLRGTPQTVRFISVETYIRKNGATNTDGRFVTPHPNEVYSPYRPGSTVTWWNSAMPGAFWIRNGALHFRQAKPFAVSLDLRYDESAREWRGGYASPYYNGNVILVRPRMDVAGTPAGVWMESASRGFDLARNETRDMQCLYAALGEDGQLVLWGQYVQENAATPLTSEATWFDESYGEALTDTLTTHTGSAWSFLYANGMWSERITGTLSADGSTFSGQATDHQGNGAVPIGNPPQPFAWKRAAGDSCLP